MTSDLEFIKQQSQETRHARTLICTASGLQRRRRGEKPLSSLPQQHLIGRLQREAELKGEREMDGGVLRERGGFFLLGKDMRD